MAFWNRNAQSPSKTEAPAAQTGGVSQVKRIVAVGSGKGGVGKSTVSLHLAIALQKKGLRVGLMDADIYGPSQPSLLGAGGTKAEADDRWIYPVQAHGIQMMSMGLLMPSDGPVVWRAPMAMKAIQQFLTHVAWGELDVLVVDLPPGTGDVQLTLAQQAALGGAVVVTTPQDVAVGIAKKGLKMFQQVKVPILGVVENMSGYTCDHCGELTRLFPSGGGEQLAKTEGVPFLGGIPMDAAIVRAGDEGKPVMEVDPGSRSSEAFLQLADAVMDRLYEGDQAQNGEPEAFQVRTDGSLQITWPGRQVQDYSAYELRISCPCASCVDENTGKKILDDQKVPLDIQVTGAQAVGRYALGLRFSDGHSTGIFAYPRLRKLTHQEQMTL